MPPPASEPITSVRYQEPIARNLRQGWLGLNQWWSGLKISGGSKTLILAIAVIFCAFNAGGLVGLLVMAIALYIPYYCVWWILRGPQPLENNNLHRNFASPVRPQPAQGDYFRARRERRHQQRAAAARNDGQPVAAVVEPPPLPRPAPTSRQLSVKQWKIAKRMQLATIPRPSVWGEVTGSWLGSVAVISVFGALAVLFQIGSGKQAQPILIGMIWAAMVSLVTAWVSIGLGKRWQREEGDWAIRSFTQLTWGFAIGALAYLLSDYLIVPWETITTQGRHVVDLPVQRWSGFFAQDGSPLLPAYLAYFPLVMGLVHWWKQVDPLRRTRFSFLSVIWSVIAASIVYLLIPFPQPWGALIAAGTSMAIQLSSPWINPTERLQVDHR
ncbi:MAG: hypothetical protein KDA51_14945, partial [Planctomycetales bacterium]|nr:hypothetical protein [Planctomycetales bacterium]